jgi:glyoxylase-like metal-dependent hydrolase (beta-lactamase superfamily II)
MEIVRGIHQIKIPFPQGIPEQTNVYVVEGSKGNIMVDAGWDTPEALSVLHDGLRKDYLRLKDVKMIVITHIHPDHYGLASKIKQLCDAKMAMHRIEAELINSRYVNLDELLNEMEGELRRGGVPQAELPEFGKASLWMKQFVMPESPDVILDDGAKISNGSFEFEVLRTPGHSPGHICLYEPARSLLFSGDHVLFETTPHVGFHPQSGDNPLDDYINSLKMIEELKANFVFPGHGPVFNSLKLRIAGIIWHHEQRKRVIMKAIGDGLKSAYQIAKEIPWKPQEGGVSFGDLALWDRRLAVMETIAHLKLLMSEGEVGKIDRDGVSLYLAKG